jgi:hypothetical protein
MNKLETERFERIKREALHGFPSTFRDLLWLIRLVDRLL